MSQDELDRGLAYTRVHLERDQALRARRRELARRGVARRATSPEDYAELLAMLGLEETKDSVR